MTYINVVGVLEEIVEGFHVEETNLCPSAGEDCTYIRFGVFKVVQDKVKQLHWEIGQVVQVTSCC